MRTNKLEKLLTKYFSRSITSHELDELNSAVENNNSYKVLQNYFKINYAINYNMCDFNPEKAKIRFQENIKESKNFIYKKKSLRFLKYAALVLVLITTSIFITTKLSKTNQNISSLKGQIIDNESITITLADGTINVISENEDSVLMNKKGDVVGQIKNNKIEYNQKSKSTKITYNEICVPYTKRFKLELSDGSIVHLNAGSSLKYPTNFVEGQNREVLLRGEGYFDIKKNKASPFIVSTGSIDITVLGTKFNVSYYPGDDIINTVLVEGSVALYHEGEKENENKSVTLSPNQMATWNKDKKSMLIKHVDPSLYTSWTKGILVFENTPLFEVVKTFERWYGVQIDITNPDIEDCLIRGKYDKQTLITMLQTLKFVLNIKYEINGDKVIINEGECLEQ